MEKLPKSAAAAAASDVPIDVIRGILLCLPVKSVLRFRCLSKSLYSLINESHFKRSHLLQSHDQVLVLQCPDKYYSFYDGPFFDDIVSGESTQMESLFTPILAPSICYGTKLLAACDGLLLLRNCDNYGQLTLLNPSTRECRYLQDLPMLTNSNFNISDYDLGYDLSTDDYKVLLRRTNILRGIVREARKEINILSVKTNCWRKVKDFTVTNYNTVNLNGSLNWVNMRYCKGSPWSKGMFSSKIVSFSLANESIIEMEHPYSYNKFSWLNLGVLQGCLCLTVIGDQTRSLTIWLMKEFGETSSWTKVTTIESQLDRADVSNDITLLPLKNMNRIVFLSDRLYHCAVELLILDDLEAEEVYKIVKITNFPMHKLPHLVTFSRSLISPN
ncbi:F-box protein CPR1-like [Mercurialis annua]|uniref:F-box protein CPR1-like n=1 Tax=Mercurialis annua TaxID=3986 RepID=UPI00216102EE|nr:F-box protein CPR1-like [Mercurialis annua]